MAEHHGTKASLGHLLKMPGSQPTISEEDLGRAQSAERAGARLMTDIRIASSQEHSFSKRDALNVQSTPLTLLRKVKGRRKNEVQWGSGNYAHGNSSAYMLDPRDAAVVFQSQS